MPGPMTRQMGMRQHKAFLRSFPVRIALRLGAWGLLFGVSVWGIGRATADEPGLVVPVFPKGAAGERPADLADSYVVLEDGSVVSMADWVLAPLRRGEPGAGMSDYENRFFLGQVARAMIGQGERLVSRDYRLPATPGDALGPAWKGMTSAELATAFGHTPYVKPEAGGAYTGGTFQTGGSAFMGTNPSPFVTLLTPSFEEYAGNHMADWREIGLAKQRIGAAEKAISGH